VLPLYIGTFTIGAVLILASIVFGGSEHDFDHDADIDGDFDVDFGVDADADADAGAGADAGLWLPFLSMRFWTFSSASFGASGLLLSILGTASLITLITSSLLAMFMGWSVAFLFHKLKHATVTGEITTSSLQGSEARVMLSLDPNKTGKIRLSLDGKMLDLPAQTQDQTTIDRGDKVLIVSVDKGVAQVTPLRVIDKTSRTLEQQTTRKSKHQTQEN